MQKRERLINELSKKLGSGTNSFNVLVFQFKRKYPTYINLIREISKAETSFDTSNELSDEELDKLIMEIKKI